jgi:hypothetical protein
MMAGMIRVVMSGAVAQANAIATLEAKVFQRALDHTRISHKQSKINLHDLM